MTDSSTQASAFSLREAAESSTASNSGSVRVTSGVYRWATTAPDQENAKTNNQKNRFFIMVENRLDSRFDP